MQGFDKRKLSALNHKRKMGRFIQKVCIAILASLLFLDVGLVGVAANFGERITTGNTPVATQTDFSENGHSEDDLDTWDPIGNADATPYDDGDDDPEDDWDDLDPDAYYLQYEPFRPYYDAPPEAMSAFEIAAFANQTIGVGIDGEPVPVHIIESAAHMRAFLNGTLGENHHHFVVRPDIQTISIISGDTNFTTRGRPGIFTGIFDGNGVEIQDLRLRAVGTVSGVENENIGFVRRAGHGAVIRNVDFFNDAFGGNDTRLGHFTASANRGIGTIIGSTVGGGEGVVSIHNVQIISRGTSAGAGNAPAGNRPSMTFTGVGNTNTDVGGMVGRVGSGSTLNITDVTTHRMTYVMQNASTSVRTMGGLVGAVHGGTLNVGVTTGPLAIRGENRLDASMRAATQGSTIFQGVNNGPDRVGGVVGFIFSGHVNISDTTIMGSRNHEEPMRARSQAGGIIGGLNVQGTARLTNVENRGLVTVMRNGGNNTVNGRAGGLVGFSAGTLHIYNSRNFGVVQHRGNNAAFGGLLGYGGTSSRIVIDGSQNGASPTDNITLNFSAQGAPGELTHRNNADGANNNTAAAMGGIAGRTRGSIVITNSTNYANFTKNAVGTGATPRQNTRVGGIIGRIHPVGGQFVTIENVTNNGNISVLDPRGSVGGVMGDLMIPPRGTAAINLRNVTNNGTITGATEAGGIIGWIRPRNVNIENATNNGAINRASGSANNNDAGGIIGRAGGAGLRLTNGTNHGNIHATGVAAIHAGGIIGRSTGAGLNLRDVYNIGTVRGRDHVAGIVGFANGNDANIEGAVNRGNVTATRSGGAAAAGGIVGRSARRNMIIREAGNFATVTMTGNNNNNDGVAGILGRSHGANTVIERSFNQGAISGRNSAGGIVGRNQGNLNITDVYNIGPVAGGTQNGAPGNRAGNGILGRRRSGTVRITRAWVSARVGGYAVATHQANVAQQAVGAPVTGITFNNVFVDETAFVTTGTGFNANVATQSNRTGINVVDTELLTSGYLPGFNSGAWRIGFANRDDNDLRTYPYLAWQIPNGGLQPEFFTTVRSQQIIEGEPRMRPVMDLENVNSPIEIRGVAEGSRLFDNYIANGFIPITGDINHNRNQAAPTSIGLISTYGVVGFEAREVTGRLIVRGYDPLFGASPNYDFIDHARFEIVSTYQGNPENIDLNRVFRECPETIPTCTPDEMIDSSRGIGIILYDVLQGNPPQVLGGLRPQAGQYEATSASNPSPTDLTTYTVVRITALGYAPAYRIVRLGELDENGNATINVPMERVPFAIRAWIPQTLQGEEPPIPAAEEDWIQAAPGTRVPANPPLNARPGFGRIAGMLPGSYLAANPSLTITRATGNTGANLDLNYPANTVENGISGMAGHFAITDIMWGDTLVATATSHTTNTNSGLRFNDLIDRGINAPGVAEEFKILDLDLYVTNIGLPQMYVRFIELTGNYNDDGAPEFRIVNLTNLTLTSAGATITPMTAAAGVHNPLYANNAGGNSVWVNQVAAGAMGNMTTAAAPTGLTHNLNTMTPHFRVTGLTEDSTISVTDSSGTFVAITDIEIEEYFTYFYPLVNTDARQDAGYGELFTFANINTNLTGNNARNTQLNAALDSDERGNPYLVRTLVVPLRRSNRIEVRVVERLEDGTYEPIPGATLTHNGAPVNPEADNNGRFLVEDDDWNIIVAGAGGFREENNNIYSRSLEELLCMVEPIINDDTGLSTCPAGQNRPYIRIVLEREPAPEAFRVDFDLTGGHQDPLAQEDQFAAQYVLPGETATDPAGNHPPIHPDGAYYFVHWASRTRVGIEAGVPLYSYQVWDFDMPISENLTLFARWTPVFPVTFETNEGGRLLQGDVVLSVNGGETVAAPSVPTAVRIDASYEFSHWESPQFPDVRLYNAQEIGDLIINEETVFIAIFTRIGNRVTFDLTGGTYQNGDPDRFDYQVITHGQLATRPTPDPVHPQEQFVTWAIRTLYTVEEGAAVYHYEPWDFNTPVTSNIDLFAVWTPIRLVTFEASANGALFAPHPGFLILSGLPIGTNEVLTPMPNLVPAENYEFSHWTSNEARHIGDFTYLDGRDLRDLIIYEDTVFTAHFRRVSRTMTFIAEAGGTITGPNPELTITHGSTVEEENLTVPAAAPDENYEFIGWFIREGNLNVAGPFTADEVANMRVEADTTFVAVFTLVTRTVRFDPNSGAFLPAHPDYDDLIDGNVVREVEHGSTVGINAFPSVIQTHLVRDGYTFIGWHTAPNLADGVPFTALTPVIGDMTVYAIWTQIPPRITFSVTGGDGTIEARVAGAEIASGDEILPIGSDVVLTVTPATGYAFVEWRVDGQAHLEASTTLTLSNVTNNVTAQAVVAPIRPVITFAMTGGSGTIQALHGDVNVPSGTEVPYNSTIEFIVTPALGYEVVSWSEDGTVIPGEIATTFTLANVTESTDVLVTLDAVYVDYAFTFGNDFASYNRDGSVRYGETPAGPTEIPIHVGFRFNGWNPAVGPITVDTTFSADWAPTQVPYRFDWQYLHVIHDGQTGYNALAVTVEPAPSTTPNRPGYHVAGWALTPTGPAVDLTEIRINDVYETTVFYAVWAENSEATVRFALAGGNVAGATDDIEIGLLTGQTVGSRMPEAPTRDGYDFVGWFIDGDATKAFAANTVVTEDMLDAAGIVHVVAVWQAVEVDVILTATNVRVATNMIDDDFDTWLIDAANVVATVTRTNLGITGTPIDMLDDVVIYTTDFADAPLVINPESSGQYIVTFTLPQTVTGYGEDVYVRIILTVVSAR